MTAPRLISRLLPAACAAALFVGAAGPAQTALAQTNGPVAPPQPPNAANPVPPLNPAPSDPNDPVPKSGVVTPPPTGDKGIQKQTPNPGPNSMPVIPPPANTVPK